MEEYKLKLLKDFFSVSEPMGPVYSDKIIEPSVMKVLFNTENRIYQQLSKKPTLIVGRKGSGKTAFLRSIQLNEQYRIVTEIKAHEAFLDVINIIEKMAIDLPFVESVSEIWETVFWTSIFSELAKQDFKYEDGKSLIEKYLAGIKIKNESGNEKTLRRIIETISLKSQGLTGVAAAIVSKLVFNDVSFINARDAAKQILKNNKIRAVVLMDSMENFPLEQQKVARALAGLLKCIGQFHNHDNFAEIRFCVPAEMWHSFYKLSSNPLKDFERHVTIHWHAGELIRIVAGRLAIYLALHEPNLYNRHYLKIPSFPYISGINNFQAVMHS